MSRRSRPHEQVFTIVRLDDGASGADAVTVQQIVRDLEIAEREVARLNALNGPKGARYHVQAARLYAPGEAAGSALDGATTVPGFVNRNRQRMVRETGLPGNDHLQQVYVLRCAACGTEYGANGSDIFQRRCPQCQDGAPGLAY